MWKLDKEDNFIHNRKTVKFLGINLTKGGVHWKLYNFRIVHWKLYDEKVEEDKQVKESPCSWIGSTNIIQVFIISKGIYRFYAIPFKIPMEIFIEIIYIANFVCNFKRPQLAKAILRKKSKTGSIRHPNLKL